MGIAIFAEEAVIFYSLAFSGLIVIVVGLFSIGKGLKVVLKRCLYTILGLCLLIWSLSYYSFANQRANLDNAECQRQASSNGRYIACVCHIRNHIVLRLFNANDECNMIAERTFANYGEPARIYWENSKLEYEDGHDLSIIDLPPSLHDRLLARLP